MALPKAFLSWSSGKDSAFALHATRTERLADIAGVLTTFNDEYDRVAMHGVRRALFERQMAALGLPAIRIALPDRCSNEIYEARMEEACRGIKAQGIEHIVFGDLFLEDLRRYREEKLAIVGMRGLFPLWKRDTASLAREMIANGLVAYVACLDPRRLDPSFAGRRFDETFLADLPQDVDPCGENGEFHTVVTEGPMFDAPIRVEIGETVEREGFVFTDVIPV